MSEFEIYEYYACKELDWILLNWMSRMEADGELTKTLSVGNGTPTYMLQFFQNRRLFFTTDEFGNLTRACWIEPCMGSVFIGFYIHPNVRADQKGKVFFLYDMINAIFNQGVPVIAGFIQERPTSEETSKFIKLHERLGYRYRGFVPHFFDGRDCHIVAITKENWEQGTEWKRRWEKARGIDGRR